MYHVKFDTIHLNLQVLPCILYSNNLTIIYAAHNSQLVLTIFCKIPAFCQYALVHGGIFLFRVWLWSD